MESKRVAVTLRTGDPISSTHRHPFPGGRRGRDPRRGSRHRRGVARGEAGWLSFGNGQGWVRVESVAEVMLVDYLPEEPSYEHQIFD